MAVDYLVHWEVSVVSIVPHYNWDRFQDKYMQRLEQLQYFEIIQPYRFFTEIKEGEELYGEAVLSYLLGLPNGVLPLIVRCMQIGLKHKYETIEKQKVPENLKDLIDWGEKYLSSKKELAHGFRLLRNLIHEETLIKEQDALEAIRHVSEILNLLYPFGKIEFHLYCGNCRIFNQYIFQKDECWLGNSWHILCQTCRASVIFTVWTR